MLYLYAYTNIIMCVSYFRMVTCQVATIAQKSYVEIHVQLENIVSTVPKLVNRAPVELTTPTPKPQIPHGVDPVGPVRLVRLQVYRSQTLTVRRVIIV